MGSRRVVAGITVGVAGLVLAGCGWVGNEKFDDHEALGGTVTEVRFDNDSGDITIRTGDTVEVKRTVSYGGDKPGKTYRVEDGVLIVEHCPVRDCSIDYELTVPADVNVSGHVDSGTVDVAGVATANVEAESGDVTIRDVAGKVNASVQSGTIDLTGIGGSVVAGAESGDVTVGLSAVNSVSVETQSGNIDVTAPSGEYHVQASTESGSLTNDLGDDPSGTPIDLSAQSGDVTVRAA
jgi:putative adhesin